MVKNIIIAIIFAGVGFFTGLTYQKSRTSSFSNPRSQFAQNNPVGNQRRLINGQMIGEVTSINDKSITVKMTDGSSKLILTSDKTTISRATSASLSDITLGQRVAVFGNPNPDSSISAQNIQLDPVERRRPEVTSVPLK